MHKIVFMGADAIAVPALKYLAGHPEIDLAAVVSQPDRPVGRGKKMQPNPLAAYARDLGLVLMQPEKPGHELVEWIIHQQVDLAVVMAYGHLVRRQLLNAPKLGMVNLHASLLPAYRGASPIVGALTDDLHETGVTLMQMTPPMDEGPAYASERVLIESTDNRESLTQKMADACPGLLERALWKVLNRAIPAVEQNAEGISYTRKITKVDAALDFSRPAKVLACRMRALDPWPGSYADHGDVRLKMRLPHVIDRCAAEVPGTILSVDESGISVATAEGILCCEYWQRPGGKMMPAADFLRGYSLKRGDRLTGGPMQALVSNGTKF